MRQKDILIDNYIIIHFVTNYDVGRIKGKENFKIHQDEIKIHFVPTFILLFP
jgi:hypothetical protein